MAWIFKLAADPHTRGFIAGLRLSDGELAWWHNSERGIARSLYRTSVRSLPAAAVEGGAAGDEARSETPKSYPLNCTVLAVLSLSADPAPGGDTPGRVYALGFPGRVAALSSDTGGALWCADLRADGGGPAGAALRMDGAWILLTHDAVAGRVYAAGVFGSDEKEDGYLEGRHLWPHVTALSAESGATVWSRRLVPRPPHESQPVDSCPRGLVADRDTGSVVIAGFTGGPNEFAWFVNLSADGFERGVLQFWTGGKGANSNKGVDSVGAAAGGVLPGGGRGLRGAEKETAND
eukprot:gene37999-14311_t